MLLLREESINQLFSMLKLLSDFRPDTNSEDKQVTSPMNNHLLC